VGYRRGGLERDPLISPTISIFNNPNRKPATWNKDTARKRSFYNGKFLSNLYRNDVYAQCNGGCSAFPIAFNVTRSRPQVDSGLLK